MRPSLPLILPSTNWGASWMNRHTQRKWKKELGEDLNSKLQKHMTSNLNCTNFQSRLILALCTRAEEFGRQIGLPTETISSQQETQTDGWNYFVGNGENIARRIPSVWFPKLLHRIPASYLPGLVKPVHLHSHLCIYIIQPVSSLASAWSDHI